MEKELRQKVLKYIGSAGVFITVSVYLLYHLFFSSANSIVTEYAYPVTERITLSCDAYIMRNEKVIDGGSMASAAYYFEDGTKIPKNAVVASVYSGDEIGHGDTIIDIDKQISFLEKSNTDNVYAVSDTTNIDKKLNEMYYDIRMALADGSVGSALSKSDDMLTMINRRMVITGEVSGFDSKISQLQKQREKYASSFGSASETVVSDLSGYFYTACDGYEEIFTADEALSMTYDDFLSMTSLSPDSSIVDSLGKVAYDYRWYLVCPVEKSELKNYNVGNYYTVVFELNSGKELSLKLAKTLADTSGDGAVLIFESFDCPSGFSFTRLQPVEVVQSSITGIRVPTAALRIVDGEQGVYILYGSRVFFCKLKIIGQNENYYIADVPDLSETPYGVLCVYDNIIVSGKNLYEGKVING